MCCDTEIDAYGIKCQITYETARGLGRDRFECIDFFFQVISEKSGFGVVVCDAVVTRAGACAPHVTSRLPFRTRRCRVPFDDANNVLLGVEIPVRPHKAAAHGAPPERVRGQRPTAQLIRSDDSCALQFAAAFIPEQCGLFKKLLSRRIPNVLIGGVSVVTGLRIRGMSTYLYVASLKITRQEHKDAPCAPYRSYQPAGGAANGPADPPTRERPRSASTIDVSSIRWGSEHVRRRKHACTCRNQRRRRRAARLDKLIAC
ncbi:hypothetical protein EVAR_86525_1 [Eumeta japonica]|uniref:Uncharacterized protein n=1 Tax=Eumeta variegata TaxID=151549 RepID=A0A4C1VQB1_EUMVA|nr:hypothetical protein EVAR_86525_1 [Eumeta japonica]